MYNFLPSHVTEVVMSYPGRKAGFDDGFAVASGFRRKLLVFEQDFHYNLLFDV